MIWRTLTFWLRTSENSFAYQGVGYFKVPHEFSAKSYRAGGRNFAFCAFVIKTAPKNHKQKSFLHLMKKPVVCHRTAENFVEFGIFVLI